MRKQNFDSARPTVLTNSMLNCRQVEEDSIPIMQVESGVQMHSKLKCYKTFYFNPRDGNIQAVESDALTVSSVKQDLIGERAVTKALISKKFSKRTLMSAGFIFASMENCAVSNNSFLSLVMTGDCFD